MKKNLLLIFALLCVFAQGAWSEIVDLSNHPDNDEFTVLDGDVLTGNLSGGVVYIPDGATVTLSGINLTAPDEDPGDRKQGTIQCRGNATIILAKGTTNYIRSWKTSAIYVQTKGKTLTIEGAGSLHAEGCREFSGIGGCTDSNIVINEGNITAESHSYSVGFDHALGGAGIGGGEGVNVNITINGGTITATGGYYGAGIGGGNGAHGGTIIINGGTIVAKGGNDAAGIGGGEGGSGGNIYIYGGTITATGGYYGAGIGGGDGAWGGAIWITGGTVKAYGGKDAAGIGGGEDGNSGSITINGGDVYACGSGYGVGIGAGEDGDVDNTISINGGTVEAFGGDDINRAIGGEDDEDYSNISIDSKMKVTDASTFGSTLSFAIRGLFLSSYYHLKFEPCDHAGQTLSYAYVDENKHKFVCQWCGWHEEAHTLVFDNQKYICTKCDYSGTPYHVHYYEMVYDETSQQYKYQDVASAVFKSFLILPELSSPVPTGKVFAGWVAGAPDAGDDGLLKDGEITPSYPLYSPGQGLSEDGDINFKARYVNKTLDLATVTTDQTVYDGVVVTGTLDTENHPVKITIANNATVTLSNANINGVNEKQANGLGLYEWAGINCKGNATIILADGTTNTVKGFYENYPGIWVLSGYSLTIKGTGSLNASSNGWGAGIGSAYGSTPQGAGNIFIQGGNITATGGTWAAGIGSNYNNSCGLIMITGGTINATGGKYAAGIGSGYGNPDDSNCSSICGAITISDNLTSLTATKGQDATNSIGAGRGGTCASVIIGSKGGAIERSPYNYVPLADASDNSSKISDFSGDVCDVTLKDRTLYKDGDWNTLCLPFDVTLAGSPLADAEARTLSSANLNDGTLTLNFSEPVTTLTAGTPYIIKWNNPADLVIRSFGDWLRFADAVNDGTNDFKGKLVVLAADIHVNQADLQYYQYRIMVGKQDYVSKDIYSFKGTFNGCGHTLTFNANSQDKYWAPFRYIENATIANLHTTGTLSASKKYCSGLVAYARGTNVINNCRSSVEINSSVSGEGTHGGLVAYTEENNSELTLNNCLFDGSIKGTNTNSCGGLVGWSWNNDQVTLNNCVFRPESITLNSGDNATFSRGSKVTINNCYYSENLPGASGQGTAIGTMTNEELVTALGGGWQIKGNKVIPSSDQDIMNPMFSGVTITATEPSNIDCGDITFVGTYDPVVIGSEGDDTKLYLSSGNTLYWPNAAMRINAFRAYFQLNLNSNVRGFSMAFLDNNEEVTGIESINSSRYDSDAWYTLDGRKINGKPAMSGMYINNGRKVVIK